MPSFPDVRTLSDGVVTLRLSAERDIPEILLAYEDDPELHVRIGMEKPPSGAELGRRAERMEGDLAAGRWVMFTILKPGSDEFRGEINVHHVAWEHRRADLGVWLAPAARGRGLARSALVLVVRWLLAECGFERVQVLTEPDNEPMLRTAAAAGFTREGVLRAYQRERGVRVDCVILAVVRADLTG
jgi:RimJ/RimL family protein N-acetyltransferase